MHGFLIDIGYQKDAERLCLSEKKQAGADSKFYIYLVSIFLLGMFKESLSKIIVLLLIVLHFNHRKYQLN